MARTTVLRGALALVLAWGASGCWLQPNADGGHTRHNPVEEALTVANAATLAQEWSLPVQSPPSPPIVVEGRVRVLYDIVVRPPGHPSVREFPLDHPDQAFDSNLVPPPPPGATGGITLVGDLLWAGARATGTATCPWPYWRLAPRWDQDPPGEGFGAPVAFVAPASSAGGTVAYAEEIHAPAPGCEPQGHRLVVLEVAGLAERYRVDAPAGASVGPPAVGGGRVVARVGDELRAYPAAGCGAATCSPDWLVDLGAPGSEGIELPPVVTGGRVIVATGDAVRAFDLDDGSALWTWRTRAITGLAVAGERVFATSAIPGSSGGGSGHAALTSLSAACGACDTWQARIGSRRPASTWPYPGPAVAGDVVYVAAGADDTGERDGRVLAFDARACASPCRPLTTVTAPGVATGLAVADGRLIVTSATPDGGAVTVFRPTEAAPAR